MKDWAPYLAMLLVQFFYVGSNFLCKAALGNGMSIFVFVVYRHVIASLQLGPFAYYHERKRWRSLTRSTMMKIWLLALCGVTVQQNLHYAGLRDTTPTVASALNNLIPSVTFVLAVLFRMEKIGLKSPQGQAKVLGTLMGVGGALLFTFWKGVVFKGFQNPVINIYAKTSLRQRQDDWIKGSALIASSYIAFSSSLILQTVIYHQFPAPLSITALTCSFSTLQALVIALAFERHSAAWRLQWNLELVTIVYCGTIMSSVVYFLQTRCISKKGPVFVSSFQPLLFAIVGLLSFLLFAEHLHLGSLIGAIIIIIGLYCVLWGKSKDNFTGTDEETGNCSKDTHTDTVTVVEK